MKMYRATPEWGGLEPPVTEHEVTKETPSTVYYLRDGGRCRELKSGQTARWFHEKAAAMLYLTAYWIKKKEVADAEMARAEYRLKLLEELKDDELHQGDEQGENPRSV